MPSSDTVVSSSFSPAEVALASGAPVKLVVLLPGLLLALLLVLAVWASFASVEIIASASGQIVPSERVKLVQPLEPGVVREIRVQPGRAVKVGDPLVELDPTETAAERERLRWTLSGAQLDVARLRALITALEAPPSGSAADARTLFLPPAGLPVVLVETQASQVASQWERLCGERALALHEQARLQAQRDGIAAQIAKEVKVLPVLRERVRTRELLAEQQLLARSQLLELRETLIKTEEGIAVLQASLREAEAALSSAVVRQRQGETETRAAFTAELTTREQVAATAALELTKAEERARRRTLTAPVNGIVTDLAVHTVGGVVREAETLMRIVPEDEKLEVEALLANRDIGFVEKGQAVTVKVDAFPYLRHGVIPGTVADVSADAVAGADGRSSAFKLRIALSRQALEVEGRRIALMPGMSVTADVRTGRRHVIEYLLQPVLRYASEGLRER